MPEEELRQACELIGRIENSPHNDWAMADCYGGKEAFLVARALLSRLDREAEAERRLKVAREAARQAAIKALESAVLLSQVAPSSSITVKESDRLDAAVEKMRWVSRALAEIAPAAPEGPKP